MAYSRKALFNYNNLMDLANTLFTVRIITLIFTNTYYVSVNENKVNQNLILQIPFSTSLIFFLIKFT